MGLRDDMTPMDQVLEDRSDYRSMINSPPGTLLITKEFHKLLIEDWNTNMVEVPNARDATDAARLGEEVVFEPETKLETMEGMRLFGMQVRIIPPEELPEGATMVIGPALDGRHPRDITAKQWKDNWRVRKGLPPLDVGDPL